MKIKLTLIVILEFFLNILFIPIKAHIVNPVLPGDYPDPSVIKIHDTYWATATSNEWAPLFPIFKSMDLENWELVNYVFPEGAPDWALNNFWAPELSYDEKQEKVYLYYTARDKKTNRLACAVAVSDSPLGKFRDLGVLVSQEAGSIDAFATRDEQGKLYLIWKEDGNSMGLPTHIWAQEMSEDRTMLLGEMTSLISNDTAWEEGLVEGPCVFQKGNYFYMLYSAAGCCDKNCNYKTGVARSEKLLGPWEKYEKNPILVDNDDWKCAGHGTVVERNGKSYYLYHAYHQKGSVYVGRQGVLEELHWNDDDWCYFENNTDYNRSCSSLNYTDNFINKTLNPVWQWHVKQDIVFGIGKNGLMLNASMENKGLGSLLVQPIKALNFTLTATIDVKNSSAAGGVGIIGGAHNGFGAPLAGFGISVLNNGLEVWKNIDGKITTLAHQMIECSENLKVRMLVHDGYLLGFEYNIGGEWKMLMKEFDVSSYVPWGMGFHIGLCAKGENSTSVYFRKVELIH